MVITGASSGIGAVTAKALAAQGDRIVSGALDKDGLDALVADIEAAGGKATALVTDVVDAHSVEGLADHAIATFGTTDVLVNNAGLMLFSSWKDRALDDWIRMVDVDIRGYLNSIHAVLPTMLDNKSGHILNMASVAGHAVGEGVGVYSARLERSRTPGRHPPVGRRILRGTDRTPSARSSDRLSTIEGCLG